MSTVGLAALQFGCSWNREENIAKAERGVREAAGRGANVVLISELFETPYFCAVQRPEYLELARPLSGQPTIEHFRALARELGVVIPVSVFEQAGNVRFNSIVVIDADGKDRGTLPQEPHSAGVRIRGEVLLLARRYGIRTHLDRLRQAWDRNLLGPVVSRGGPIVGPARRGVSALPDRDRFRTERSRA